MIVTCPKCAKRYMLDDALLPKEGRQVRCITCEHIWHQNLEVSSYHTSLPLNGLNEEATLRYPSSRKKSSGKLWLISIAFLLFSISFLIIGRNLIVPFIPSLERYYELVGLPISLAGSGLEITNSKTQILQEGQNEMIMVAGDLVNTSSRVLSIPPLKVMIVGSETNPKCLENLQNKECILDQWHHRLSEQSLLPGEQIHFETEARPKVEGTSHISIEF